MSSQSKYSDYFTHVDEFNHYISNDKSTHVGTIGLKKSAKYVCKQKLNDFWTDQRLRDILNDLPGCEKITIDEIREEYLITLSILCFISKGDMPAVRHLRTFFNARRHDLLLPSSNWSEGKFTDLKETLEAFIKHQWIFIPYELTKKVKCWREMDQNIILPFDQSDLCKLREYCHSPSQIYSVKIRSCCARINKVDSVPGS